MPQRSDESIANAARLDCSFLSAAACAISSVYIATQSAVAATDAALVAVVVILRPARRR